MTETPSTASSTASPTRVSWSYRIMFTLAAAVGGLILAFFFVGLADGTVSSFNTGLWLGLLAVTLTVLFFGHLLHVNGHNRSAIAVLALLAVPGLLYALFMLLIIASGESWN